MNHTRTLLEFSDMTTHASPLLPPIAALSISPLLAFLLATCLSLAAYLTYLRARLHDKKQSPPFSSIPTLPNVHWFLGHFPHLHALEPSSHHAHFASRSSPSGITGVWGDLDRRAFHVLRADHARAVLRQQSSREPMKFLARHGFKTLGEESLILVPGGARWRRQRGVVAKMFTVDAMREGRGKVGECAFEVVRWVWGACGEEKNLRCAGHGVGTVCMEAQNLFELYSLLVFGRVAMGYDFKFFEDTIEECRHEVLHEEDAAGCGQRPTCRCLRMSAVAHSFAFLQDDVAKRSKPQNLFNPLMQFYSLPTAYNREYRYHSNVVTTTMGEIIGKELDKVMTNHAIKDAEKKDDSDNLVTHLVRATLEEQFQPSSQGKSSNASKCPYASSSTSPSRSTTVNSIPTSMTPAQKQETIDSVSSILRTLLMAGFETTAVSLSYVAYFLSLHPRCQDHCHREALRVLGPRNAALTYPQDFDPEDLVYCRAVFTETIRIHLPVIFTTRVLEKEMSFDTGVGEERVTFPRRTKAFVSPTAVHADERNFERAKEFVPERWVKRQDDEGGERWVERNYEEEMKQNTSRVPSDPATPESISAANPQNFFSFSDGARNCVGKRLAILESSVMIAMMCRDLTVELAEDKFELVTKRKFATVGPVRLPVVFRRRED